MLLNGLLLRSVITVAMTLFALTYIGLYHHHHHHHLFANIKHRQTAYRVTIVTGQQGSELH